MRYVKIDIFIIISEGHRHCVGRFSGDESSGFGRVNVYV